MVTARAPDDKGSAGHPSYCVNLLVEPGGSSRAGVTAAARPASRPVPRLQHEMAALASPRSRPRGRAQPGGVAVVVVAAPWTTGTPTRPGGNGARPGGRAPAGPG